MRVITGSAKGRKLQAVPGDTTRPITDRAKEALFSILGQWIEGTRVLDLFGGTGAVGIECLSRGAAFAHFVDLNRKAVETIRANLNHCRLEADALVERADSFTMLKQYRGEPFDLIYVAPPQYQELWQKALILIDSRPELLAPDAEVVVQIHPREDAPVDLHFLQEYDRRRYGSVLLLFYAAASELAGANDLEEADDDAWEEDLDNEDLDNGDLDNEELDDEALDDDDLDKHDSGDDKDRQK
ncbi:MAG: 16S rRNA (guanine(966)-N(2))-methyltransferase RsmD [Caldilineaceae bacterium]